MAANKVAVMFILCTVVFGISHTAEAYIDKCEEECYQKCEAVQNRWVPCPVKCVFSTCQDFSVKTHTHF